MPNGCQRQCRIPPISEKADGKFPFVEPLPAALRELREELGIEAKPEELAYAGSIRCRYETEFHGKPFRDNVIRLAFVYREPVDTGKLTLWKSEVEAVRWFSLEDVVEEIRHGSDKMCISADELQVLLEYLNNDPLT